MSVDGVRWAWTRAGHPERRAAARRLLRELLAEEGLPDAVLASRCPHCGASTHGPVHVLNTPWLASVSYAGGFAIAGIHREVSTGQGLSAGHGTCAGHGTRGGFGIDAEPLVDAVRDAAGGVPGGVLRWVRTEAVLKADGRALRADPTEVQITAARDGWTARLAEATYVGREPDGPPGILVSVAVRRG
ncbi:MAG: chemotaxis protein CheY [Microbacterium sp.]|nr:MAG: chemotaxis protein CheY [Microbacterium sp.]PZU35514.1 MAG: chemotaxis protein CheY [Microbacterium sp.]